MVSHHDHFPRPRETDPYTGWLVTKWYLGLGWSLFNGIQWFSMVFNGIQMVLVGLGWSRMVLDGLSGLSESVSVDLDCHRMV